LKYFSHKIFIPLKIPSTISLGKAKKRIVYIYPIFGRKVSGSKDGEVIFSLLT